MPVPVIPTMKIMSREQTRSALYLLAEENIKVKDGEVNHYIHFPSGKEALLVLMNVRALLSELGANDIIAQRTPQHQVFIGVDEIDAGWQKLQAAFWQIELLQKAYTAAVKARAGKKDEFYIAWSPHYHDVKKDMEFVRTCFAEFKLSPTPSIPPKSRNGIIRVNFFGEAEISTTIKNLGPSFEQGQVRQA